jgi:hypothetical protein
MSTVTDHANRPAAPPESPPSSKTFAGLMKAETEGIFKAQEGRAPDRPDVIVHGAADEPLVRFRAADIIGLAFSGGGIRSATFNLGLLEGLHRRNLLTLFDYLSTVSGGGYVGGFWSEWLVRRKQAQRAAALFPTAARGGPNDSNQLDSSQERHLREFSAFLAPRLGLFEVETWTAVVAVVGGMVPALTIAVSVVGLALMLWLSLTIPLALDSPVSAAILVGLITSATLVSFEAMWQTVRRDSAHSRGTTASPESLRTHVIFAAVAVIAVSVMQLYVPTVQVAVIDWFAAARPPSSMFLVWHGEWRTTATSALERWWLLTDIGDTSTTMRAFSPRLFDYAIAWLGVGLAFIVLRLAFAIGRFAPAIAASYDRVLMRLLGLGLVWTLVAVLWHVVMNLDGIGRTYVLAGATGSAATFAALRNWIGVALRRPEDATLLTRLKPYLPQILAYVTIVLLAAAVGRLVMALGGWEPWLWLRTAAIFASVIALALLINPANFGLHAFYRDRLMRAYAGASNLPNVPGADARHNRATEPQDGDDRPLGELEPRPLHLVCCAANDLSGDTVETLGRGARSAVLSRYGLSVGNRWGQESNTVTLGAAITASAAAFNSNMGMISRRVGPAVAFLMTALNLRLGLWVPHPAAGTRARKLPGLLLFREMFGLTSASGEIRGTAVPPLMRDIHLSDGAHFENLALYELVRRHCRYILVSDCGADGDVAFDDLGNALRRVREDFGVEIELDIEPLRPKSKHSVESGLSNAANISEQHVAVGTIHYSSDDIGVIIYVKPTLTGDEPPDVLQYQTRNNAFPHESTGDQFYDEAQYESYRRLGLHVAERVFDFVPPNPSAEPGAGGGEADKKEPITPRAPTADWLFAEALHRWGPTPPGLVANIVSMTARFGELEIELQRRERVNILTEVFPELEFASRARGAAATEKPALATEAEDVPFFLRAIQVMEDAWMVCMLDRWWDHPLNLGWINLFARWATAPSFRFWWPVLAPMYSPGFRDFINHRFPVDSPEHGAATGSRRIAVPQKGEVHELARGSDAAPGLAEIWLEERSMQPFEWEGRTIFENLVPLPTDGGSPVTIQTGLAAVLFDRDDPMGSDVGWTSDDFFVPPSLWGAGFGWHFLDELLKTLAHRKAACCYVAVKGVPRDAQHQLAFDDRQSFIEQYRKIGFRQIDPITVADWAKARREGRPPSSGQPDDESTNFRILDKLGVDGDGDAVFRLVLSTWSRRRGAPIDKARLPSDKSNRAGRRPRARRVTSRTSG